MAIDAYIEAVNRAREMLVWSPLSLPRIAEALQEAMAEAERADDPRADNIENDVLSVVAHAQALFEKAKRAGDCRDLNERNGTLVTAKLKRVEGLLGALAGRPSSADTYNSNGSNAPTRPGRVLGAA